MNINDYIKKVGIKRICTDLGYATSTVSNWAHLIKAPRPSTAKELIEYSKGILSWSSIYEPFVTKQEGKQK